MKERRKIERKFMKEEFGNNYVSSDDDSDNDLDSSSFNEDDIQGEEAAEKNHHDEVNCQGVLI